MSTPTDRLVSGECHDYGGGVEVHFWTGFPLAVGTPCLCGKSRYKPEPEETNPINEDAE